MHKGWVWGAIAALGAAAPVFADEGGFSYSYVEAGYLSTVITNDLDDDDDDVNGDGFAINGSFELTDRFHLLASYSNQDFDIFRSNDLSAKTVSFGAGINWPLNPNLDIETHADYIRADGDFSGIRGFPGTGFSTDDDGIDLGIDLRARLGERWELQGGATYSDFDDGGDDTSLHFGARFYIAPTFAITADISGNDDGATGFIGGRFNFGQ